MLKLLYTFCRQLRGQSVWSRVAVWSLSFFFFCAFIDSKAFMFTVCILKISENTRYFLVFKSTDYKDYPVKKRKPLRELLKVTIRSTAQLESVFMLLASCRLGWVCAYNNKNRINTDSENCITFIFKITFKLKPYVLALHHLTLTTLRWTDSFC